VDINARNSTVQFTSPTNLTMVEQPVQRRWQPEPEPGEANNAGFGAATGARTMRNIQLQLRFQF